jgi:catechol 2,3-dioxygenase-like lactoylglutathione lyase family enzyme
MISDQDKAADFYTKVLGFKKNQGAPTPNGPRFLTVGLPEQDFHLVLWPGTPRQSRARLWPQPRHLHHRSAGHPQSL